MPSTIKNQQSIISNPIKYSNIGQPYKVAPTGSPSPLTKGGQTGGSDLIPSPKREKIATQIINY
jgi:hypothetical protein